MGLFPVHTLRSWVGLLGLGFCLGLTPLQARTLTSAQLRVPYVIADLSTLSVGGENHYGVLIRPALTGQIADQVLPEEYALARHVWDQATGAYLESRREAGASAELMSTLENGIDYSWGRSALIVFFKQKGMKQIDGSLLLAWRDFNLGMDLLPMDQQFPQWRDTRETTEQNQNGGIFEAHEFKGLYLSPQAPRFMLQAMIQALEHSGLTRQSVTRKTSDLLSRLSALNGDVATVMRSIDPGLSFEVRPTHYRAFGDERSALLFKRLGFRSEEKKPTIQGETPLIITRTEFESRTLPRIAVRASAVAPGQSRWTHRGSDLLLDIDSVADHLGFDLATTRVRSRLLSRSISCRAVLGTQHSRFYLDSEIVGAP